MVRFYLKLILSVALLGVDWSHASSRQEELYENQHPDISSTQHKSYSTLTKQRSHLSPQIRREIVLPANNQFQDTTRAHVTQQHPHLSKFMSNQEANLDIRSYDVSASSNGNDRSLFSATSLQNKHWMSEADTTDHTSSGIQSYLTSSRSTSVDRPSNSFTTTTYVPPSTSDQSNSIVQMLSSPRSTFLDNSDIDAQHSQQMIRPAELVGPFGQASLYSNQNASTVELHNHIVYEGPATAPPVAGDYYGSTDTQLTGTNSDLSSNAWWAIGIGKEFDRASNLTAEDHLDYCAQSGLLDEHQRALCRMHPKIMAVVARGLKLAFDECQSRFSNSRWNCSLLLEDSLDSLEFPGNGKRQVFGEFMRHSNRERSFLNAIVAAGLAHAMTKACSANELPEECSCDKVIRLRQKKENIEWTACSEDIDFGARFSHDFTDSKPHNSDTSTMVDSHNYGVGRQVFKSNTDLTCNCGDTGPCQIKRCWKQVGLFSNIGDILLERYESATHVQTSLHDPRKLRPVRRGLRRPKRKDLIFTEESPDYCSANSRLGILGTQNRQCNSTTSGPNSCSNLCCDRGHQVIVENIEEDCNCKFVWCCQLKCDKCIRHLTSEICN